MSFFDRVVKPQFKTDQEVFEATAAGAVIGHNAGLQIKDVDWRGGVRFMSFPDPLLELNVELAAYAWRWVCITDKRPDARAGFSLMTYQVALSRLLESLGRSDEQSVSDLINDRFNDNLDLLRSTKGRGAVKALATEIEDKRTLTGRQATDVIELALSTSVA